ncbi:GIY-YIG nuclease family protein [Methylobacter sp.]|uniref:GIY-YIG nuclease family protein n=1 Tax=Methylobacter sp. TaxID=2051955 RepID=UPI003DA59DA1
MMHYIYAITIDDVPIYVGYTDRSPEKRLAEHIDAAFGKYRTKEAELRIVLRGGDTLKNRLIKQAIDEGLKVDVIILEEADAWVPLDEQKWIDILRDEYDLVNVANGSIWQPYALVNGKPVPTESGNLSELRNDIQDWKRKPRKSTKTRNYKTPKPKVPLTLEEYNRKRDEWWVNRGGGVRYPDTYEEWCQQWADSWNRHH